MSKATQVQLLTCEEIKATSYLAKQPARRGGIGWSNLLITHVETSFCLSSEGNGLFLGCLVGWWLGGWVCWSVGRFKASSVYFVGPFSQAMGQGSLHYNT